MLQFLFCRTHNKHPRKKKMPAPATRSLNMHMYSQTSPAMGTMWCHARTKFCADNYMDMHRHIWVKKCAYTHILYIVVTCIQRCLKCNWCEPLRSTILAFNTWAQCWGLRWRFTLNANRIKEKYLLCVKLWSIWNGSNMDTYEHVRYTETVWALHYT